MTAIISGELLDMSVSLELVLYIPMQFFIIMKPLS